MESARKGNKILLVDDEPDLTMTFKAILQGVGFAVDIYENPLVALSNFRPHYYDLVILDIKMPEMNGFELYSEMLKMTAKLRSVLLQLVKCIMTMLEKMRKNNTVS